MTLLERLWSKIEKGAPDACWLWTGGVGQKGLPVSSLRKKSANPRRTIWEEANGRSLTRNEQIATTCGNFRCLNPAHLYIRPWCDDEARFWTHVEKTDGCWLWKSTLFGNGYASFKMQGLQRHASRVSYEIAYGVDLRGNPMFMCHHCDNPKCVRPDHLFLGTVQDNNADMWSKGRGSRGEKHGAAVRAARARKRSSDTKSVAGGGE